MTSGHELKRIVIVSDGTGGTGQRLTDAALAQYDGSGVRYEVSNIYSQVRTKKQVDSILRQLDASCMVIFTIVDEKVQTHLHQQLEARGILHYNVMAWVLRKFTQFLGVDPHYRPGMVLKMDAAYMHWVKGIDFTREHDDGRGERLAQAELVLIGPSRCGKTPLSMYIGSLYGVWVANIPVIADEQSTGYLLNKLQVVDPKKIVALDIQPEELLWHRTERVERLGRQTAPSALSDYSDLRSIRRETLYCRRLYAKQGWQTVETTRRVVEEIAEQVLTVIGHPDTIAFHRT